MPAYLAVLFLASLTAPGLAQAEWRFEVPRAPDDLGRASAVNEQGQVLTVGCGNSGMVDISITPDLRPPNLEWRDEGTVLFFHIDEGKGLQMPARCDARGCFQAPMLGDAPWPAREMEVITLALRRGASVDVRVSGQILARFDLTGSGVALNTLAEQTSCEGL
ncbi:hypothetical protein SAMN05444004_110102 [Jannaschia faecimaris]|uniref:Invasion protein IalB, involved in pathogenesis n=1 Tax=Jannaschia faecimaris TaxID=1244108 RepID=A0A1H3S468_9RHOB|nr:hypothetical protein [Jannaschia faecimaris]SDZ32408.1 hypothetical protein SAMN05444004_110102 [Jannaschia faecimaris]